MLLVAVASFDANPEGAVQKFTHFIYVQSQAKNIAKQQVIRRHRHGYLAEQRNYRSTLEEIRGHLSECGGGESSKRQVIERAERRLVRHRY